MMIPTLTTLAEQNNLTLSIAVRGGCPWQLDLYVPPLAVFGEPVRPEDCRKERADVYDRVIPELDPDIIVSMNLDYETPGRQVTYRPEDQANLRPGTPDFIALLEDTTRNSIRQLQTGGRRVVLLEPIPSTVDQTDALGCLTEADVVEQCRLVTNPEPSGLEKLYRAIATSDDRVWALNLDALVCPFTPICDPIINGMVVRTDGSHLTRTFARTLATPMAEYFKANEIIPP